MKHGCHMHCALSANLCNRASGTQKLRFVTKGNSFAPSRNRLAAGTTAWWDSEARTITCTACSDTASTSPAPAQAPLQVRDPGASLMREHDRRRLAPRYFLREPVNNPGQPGAVGARAVSGDANNLWYLIDRAVLGIRRLWITRSAA